MPKQQGTHWGQEITLARQSAFSELLTELGAAAEGAGIEIRETSYSVEAIEGSDQYGLLAVNANFRGRYENLVNLLYDWTGLSCFSSSGRWARRRGTRAAPTNSRSTCASIRWSGSVGGRGMELGADRNSLAKLGAALAILAIVVYLQFFRDESPPPMQSAVTCDSV